MLPVWQEAVKPFVKSGKLSVVGVVQEQHPDRTRLYAQWRQLGWPIFVDSLNLLDMAVVPVVIAIDEAGIVRHTRISPRNFVKKFMDVETGGGSIPTGTNVAEERDRRHLKAEAIKLDTARAWRDFGDACFLGAASIRGLPSSQESLDDASCDPVLAHEKAVELDPRDGRSQFRLGVALRKRYESRGRRAGDAQAAVDRWGRALAINPNQYIWRRRIQQYGPRLDKPYNFYYWVEQARKEITARGETPVKLAVEPLGSELAAPAKRKRRAIGDAAETGHAAQARACGSDSGRVQRDTQHLIGVETMVTPARVRSGQVVRARVTFRVNDRTRPFWNNEAENLAMCVDVPSGAMLGESALTYPNPEPPETQELRTLEFEVALGPSLDPGELKIPAYALYYVCENKGGKCRYLRNDFTLSVTIDPNAPTIR